MKKKHLFLAALAIILILSASIGTAVAYFTTYAGANGGYVIHLGHKTVIDDRVLKGNVKQVIIHNEADPGDENGKYPVFVRAQVFAGSDCTATLNASSSGWYDGGDGFIYYPAPIYTGEQSGALLIDVKPVEKADIKEGDPVDVLVTYQSVPAMFDPSGNPLLALSWTNQAYITNIGNAA